MDKDPFINSDVVAVYAAVFEELHAQVNEKERVLTQPQAHVKTLDTQIERGKVYLFDSGTKRRSKPSGKTRRGTRWFLRLR